jgi:uncharacterized membrane protein YraQ (UPF0718 family)
MIVINNKKTLILIFFGCSTLSIFTKPQTLVETVLQQHSIGYCIAQQLKTWSFSKRDFVDRACQDIRSQKIQALVTARRVEKLDNEFHEYKETNFRVNLVCVAGIVVAGLVFYIQREFTRKAAIERTWNSSVRPVRY